MSIIFALRPPPSLPTAALDEGIFLPGTNGRALILIHGLTGTPNEMRFLAWFFQAQGYTVSCPRLANHGRSLSVLQATPWEEFYASVRAAHAKLRPDHAQIFVGGLSMGALLALLLADEFPASVAGVSCLSPTLFYDGWNVPWYNFLLHLAPWTGLQSHFFFKEEPPYGLKNERIRDRVHQFYVNANLQDMHDVDRFGYPFFPVRLLTELRRLVRHLRTRLPFVHCPCQIIQARHDDMSSDRNARFIHDRVGSARKEIFYLEDSYHVITADQERGKVANRMMEFFSQVPPDA
ncbi:MAG: alpha/beta hydrolase [Opitutales bacterium]